VELEVEPDSAMLDAIDTFVKRRLCGVRETRKGRYWTGQSHGRPVTVGICNSDGEQPAAVWFSAGLNSADDGDILRKLSTELAEILGGRATEPSN
jgi:hypothetical protein